ncbi:MFS transporter [Kitasatospora kifunensis]|uniref:MFS family permease n=1 Tax=Kitasatospora kifunensis TaxID=58351 RepID=A0A7W7VVT7_KITKI|nr:MFS transporter [Kitasatospora kifunensis]MBB4924736.1 MFS family permease [Kitasatospora kifunensis]
MFPHRRGSREDSRRADRVPGERALLTGMAIDSVGSGMYVPFSLVFFRHITGLPLTVIGAVLTVAGFAAMAVLPLVGTAVDRFGARRLQLALYVLRGLGFAAYPFASSLPAFAVVALLTSIGDRGFPVAQQARIGELARGAQVERLQAIARSLANAGLGAGTLLASLIIGLLGDRGFTAAAGLNAASFFAAALLARRVPAAGHAVAAGARRTREAKGPRAAERVGYRTVLADRPYLGLTGANFLIALGYSALSVLLPVFAVSCLGAPQSLTGVAFVVNTVLCAVAGVPVARLARRVGSRTRAAALGAGFFALAGLGQVVLGTLRPHALPVVMGGLLLLVVVATVGELVHNPSAAALATAAAPVALRGRYLATYQLSWSLAKTLAPSLFTLLLAADARLPWLLVAVAALAGGALLLRLGRLLPVAVLSPAPATVGTPGSASASVSGADAAASVGPCRFVPGPLPENSQKISPGKFRANHALAPRILSDPCPEARRLARRPARPAFTR